MLDDIREWISDNLRYILLGLAILLVLIILFCVVRLVSGSGKKNENTQTPTQSTATTQNQEAAEEAATEAEASAPVAAAQTAAPASAELVQDDSAILTLVKKYYNAAASRDVTTLSEIVSPWNDSVQSIVFGNPDIESYNNLTTYSKQGVTDGSYVVYAYYESKIKDIETLVPSLSRMYLMTDDNGSLVVSSDYDTDQTISDYVNKVSADTDVQDLVAEVNEQYQKAVDSDDDLRAYVASLNTGTAAEEGEDGSGGSETSSSAGRTMTVTANTGLNIRQTPSTEAAIVGSVYHGATVTMLEEAEDGWCKIRYDANTGSVEGYVMLQYLADAQ